MDSMRINLLEHGRATEWLTSITMLAFAVILALPGDTFGGESFVGFKALGLDEATVGITMALIGSMRISALFINGNWLRSPMFRLAGAIAGAGVFASLSMSFLWPTLAYGLPFSTGFGSYLILAGFDALAAYRSGADVRLGQQLSFVPEQ